MDPPALKDISEEDVIVSARKRYNTQSPLFKQGQFSAYGHQVAGHTKEAILKYDKKILKPMIKRDLFLRELALYEEFFSSKTRHLMTPKSFVPKYFGAAMVAHTEESSEPLTYIVLEDLTYSFSRPCCLDIKMGQQTYEPAASDEKKFREVKKYPYQEEIGFRLTGFKVYDVISDSYRQVYKDFGRSLLPVQVVPGLATFFFNGIHIRRDVLIVVIQKLERLLRWMSHQTRYHFYCSSILIAYDGAVLPDHTFSSAKFTGHTNHTSTKDGGLGEEEEEMCCRHFIDRYRSSPLSGPHTPAMASPITTPTPVTDSIEPQHVPSPNTFVAVETSTCYDNAAETHRKSVLLQNPSLWTAPEMLGDDLVQVKMIDLAHSVRVSGSNGQTAGSGGSSSLINSEDNLDSGYLHGLNNLVMMLEELTTLANQLVSGNQASGGETIEGNIANLVNSPEIDHVKWL